MPQTMLDRFKNYDELGPKIDQNRFKNGATWCQYGVQDGLLGIRAVKRRSWTATPTATPIHEASLGGLLGRLLGSCWGSCWAFVGISFRDDFKRPFGRRFGPQHGRKSRPKSSQIFPRRAHFGLENGCQKRSKTNSISSKKSFDV